MSYSYSACSVVVQCVPFVVLALMSYTSPSIAQAVTRCLPAGEHLVSAVLHQCGFKTSNWSLQPQDHAASMGVVSVDIATQAMTAEQLSEVEALCNAHIRTGRSMKQMLADDTLQGSGGRQAQMERDIFRGFRAPDTMHVSLFLASVAAVSI